MSDPHTHTATQPEDWPSLDPADRPLVITHAECPDGWCCEWLFRRHFGSHADYMQAKYGDPVPDVSLRPRVYIADFSWKRPQMLHLMQQARGRVTAIDHHKAAFEELRNISLDLYPDTLLTSPVVLFDVEHCGSHLVWQFLKSAGATDPIFADGNPPLIVQLTEDRDLWRWQLPDSRELNAALASYPKTVDVWDRLQEKLSVVSGAGYWDLYREGAAILRQQDQMVRAAVGRAVEITICGYKVLAVNTTCHHSEIGGQLAEGRPFGVTYLDDLQRGLRCWSFRSRDGGIDVSDLAKSFPGGGGHPRAAGMQRPIGEPMSVLADWKQDA